MTQKQSRTVELVAMQIGLSNIRRDVICRKEGLELQSKITEEKLNKLHKKYFGRDVKIKKED